MKKKVISTRGRFSLWAYIMGAKDSGGVFPPYIFEFRGITICHAVDCLVTPVFVEHIENGAGRVILVIAVYRRRVFGVLSKFLFTLDSRARKKLQGIVGFSWRGMGSSARAD